MFGPRPGRIQLCRSRLADCSGSRRSVTQHVDHETVGIPEREYGCGVELHEVKNDPDGVDIVLSHANVAKHDGLDGKGSLPERTPHPCTVDVDEYPRRILGVFLSKRGFAGKIDDDPHGLLRFPIPDVSAYFTYPPKRVVEWGAPMRNAISLPPLS